MSEVTALTIPTQATKDFERDRSLPTWHLSLDESTNPNVGKNPKLCHFCAQWCRIPTLWLVIMSSLTFSIFNISIQASNFHWVCKKNYLSWRLASHTEKEESRLPGFLLASMEAVNKTIHVLKFRCLKVTEVSKGSRQIHLLPILPLQYGNINEKQLMCRQQ